MQILATGYTGTIGAHLSDQCSRLHVDLLNLSKTLGTKEQYKNSIIIHLAGIVGPRQVETKRRLAHEVNVTKTLEFAEKLLEYGISKFIFTSTSHLYAKKADPILEEDPIEPQNLYAEQKALAEIALSRLFLNSSADLTIVRVFSVLDWDCKNFTLGGLFRQIAEGDKSLMIRNGDDERDFLTPKSIAKKLEIMAIRDGMDGIWNMCSGNPIKVREAAARMLTSVIGDSLQDRIVQEHSDLPRIIGNNQKIRSALPDVDFVWDPDHYKKQGI